MKPAAVSFVEELDFMVRIRQHEVVVIGVMRRLLLGGDGLGGETSQGRHFYS